MCHHCQGRSDCFALGSLTHLNQVFAQGTEETSGSHISTRIQANPNCEHLSTQAANILTSSISLALEPKSFSLNITHIEETLTRHDKTRSTTSQHEFFAALASLAGPTSWVQRWMASLVALPGSLFLNGKLFYRYLISKISMASCGIIFSALNYFLDVCNERLWQILASAPPFHKNHGGGRCSARDRVAASLQCHFRLRAHPQQPAKRGKENGPPQSFTASLSFYLSIAISESLPGLES